MFVRMPCLGAIHLSKLFLITSSEPYSLTVHWVENARTVTVLGFVMHAHISISFPSVVGILLYSDAKYSEK